ncbi:putative Peptidyl-tRNA hydrolase ICT1, mitochondrial [Hypsibius exemplaris]|uniref:Large ribosomal subunit protein mL62 n=1 Tax=Hypsibius exemplaris TaxID=2072580 RepID=A0A1W0WI15_HYPEX|nr:putative Peptidyl-tRNA hydrolase ICT1, mitochondrial [Hypsibius exemplaris]
MLSRGFIRLLRPAGVFQESRSGFKSIYSLDKIYPKSEFDYSANVEKGLKEKALKSEEFHGYIPLEDLEISYSRSSGPGGQNVNKVNTKVDIRFDLKSVKWIPEHLKAQLFEKHATRITKEGQFWIQSEKTRSREFNLADCLDKIRFIIRGLDRPAPELSVEDQEELAARARKAARERLREKREHSMKKGDRQDNFEL